MDTNHCTHARHNKVAEAWICIDCGAFMDDTNPDQVKASVADHA